MSDGDQSESKFDRPELHTLILNMVDEELKRAAESGGIGVQRIVNECDVYQRERLSNGTQHQRAGRLHCRYV
jgi:hypothetical protein